MLLRKEILLQALWLHLTLTSMALNPPPESPDLPRLAAEWLMPATEGVLKDPASSLWQAGVYSSRLVLVPYWL